jgi:hypothetical protein
LREPLILAEAAAVVIIPLVEMAAQESSYFRIPLIRRSRLFLEELGLLLRQLALHLVITSSLQVAGVAAVMVVAVPVDLEQALDSQ